METVVRSGLPKPANPAPALCRRETLVRQIMDILDGCSHRNAPVSPHSFQCIGTEELARLHDFLTEKPRTPDFSENRPPCPVVTPRHGSLARGDYKRAMASYISRWGYRFPNVLAVAASVFEAVANRLERTSFGTSGR